jgi:hypothetical protein
MDLKNIAAIIAFIIPASAFCAEPTNPPVAAIVQIPGMPTLEQKYVGPQVVVACWPDGRIIWSATNAGPPFKQGQFDPAKLSALIKNLESKSTFDTNLIQTYLATDTSYTFIGIANGSRHLLLSSWHEGFKHNTNLVVTAEGVRTLTSGETHESVMQAQPESYKKFLQTWSEIKTNLTALIPQKGEPLEGDPSIQIWRNVSR